MNQQDPKSTPTVVTFSNIPLDDTPVVIGYEAPPPEAAVPDETEVVSVQFKRGGKEYFFNPGNLTVKVGDDVIIETARGIEYGYCSEGNHKVPASSVVPPFRMVIRIATEKDKTTRKEYKEKEPYAFDVCQDKILLHKLDMKLVSAEYNFDGSKLVFCFTSDGRVDFRDLVKDLASIFRTRIELRQIGVRDEAKLIGGLGICGRPFCCKQFLDDFQPVSIKMAKTQGLSLNPTKISGTCGRLMCCLKYEQNTYESLIRECPKTESLVNTYDGVGTITDTNILKSTVKVRLDKDPSTQKTYGIDEIAVLRSGKPKKNDPPIDTDIPPLPKPETTKPKEEEFTLFDESQLGSFSSIRSATAAAASAAGISEEEKSEPAQNEKPAREKSEQRISRSHRSRSRGKGSKPAAAQSSEHANQNQNKPQKDSQKPQKQASGNNKQENKPAAEGSAEPAKKRRSNHRRYRGKKPSSSGTPQQS